MGSSCPTGRRGRGSQSEFNLLGDAESVINLDPEITDGALQLRMPQQQLDRSIWTKVVDKMIKWGAPVSAEERKVLLDYLSTYHGPGEK